MQRSEINIHPLSDSDNSEEDDDFAPIHGTPDSSSAAPSYPLASNGGSHTADADPDRGRPSYVTSEREPQQLGTDRALDPAEPDDSLRIKDLDTGRELRFQQRNTIRDIDTGQVYVLDVEDEQVPDSADDTHGGYTDVISGTKMSPAEFDRVLGLAGTLGSARRRRLEGLSVRSDSGETSSASEPAASSSRKGGKAKQWLKRRSNVLFQRTRFSKDAKTAGQQQEGSPGEESRQSGEAQADEYASDGEASSQAPSTASSTPVGRSNSFTEGMAADEKAGAPASVGVPVKVHVHRKLHKDLAGLRLVQELHAHSGVMWTMKFSKNGHYLASAGQDAQIRIWEIVASRGGPPAQAEENGHASIPEEDAQPDSSAERTVLKAEPVRVYRGHKHDVLDVAWSKSQFLLSASMDKSVRLWHISMDDCLRVFRHTDFVTALDFHPIDDKFFLSGSIDGKVRVWNIPEQKVVDYADVHEMVTAVAWDERGERVVVGSMKGKCRFYTCTPRTHALEYAAQIDVKNKRGKASKGRKITGMQFAPGEPDALLITSNDSRIRLYDGYALRCKYKGNSNRNTQIRATFSQGGSFVICGSDDGWVYVWSLAAAGKEKSAAYECFHAHDDIVTVAVFAPETAWLPVPQSPSATDKSKASGVSEGMSKLGLRSKLSKSDSANASAAAHSATGSTSSNGAVILTAGYGGEIKVFESLSGPYML